MVDPTGRFADYYDTNGNWQFTDNIRDNKVYVVTQVNEPDGSTNYIPQDLGITHTEFQKRAATAYGESSAFRSGATTDLANEMKAIAYVNQRNSVAYGANNSQAQAFINTSLQNRTGKMQFANAAIINQLMGGPDPSNNATMWDGAEQALFPASDKRTSVPPLTRKGPNWELHQNTMGWDISNQHYATWKANVGKGFKAPQTTQAVPGTRNAGKTRLHSTAVYGRTIFWRVTP